MYAHPMVEIRTYILHSQRIQNGCCRLTVWHQNFIHHNVEARRSAVMSYYKFCFERFQSIQHVEVIKTFWCHYLTWNNQTRNLNVEIALASWNVKFTLVTGTQPVSMTTFYMHHDDVIKSKHFPRYNIAKRAYPCLHKQLFWQRIDIGKCERSDIAISDGICSIRAIRTIHFSTRVVPIWKVWLLLVSLFPIFIYNYFHVIY